MTDSAITPRNGSGAMFDAIAPRYDLVNRIISAGHRPALARPRRALAGPTPKDARAGDRPRDGHRRSSPSRSHGATPTRPSWGSTPPQGDAGLGRRTKDHGARASTRRISLQQRDRGRTPARRRRLRSTGSASRSAFATCCRPRPGAARDGAGDPQGRQAWVNLELSDPKPGSHAAAMARISPSTRWSRWLRRDAVGGA